MMLSFGSGWRGSSSSLIRRPYAGEIGLRSVIEGRWAVGPTNCARELAASDAKCCLKASERMRISIGKQMGNELTLSAPDGRCRQWALGGASAHWYVPFFPIRSSGRSEGLVLVNNYRRQSWMAGCFTSHISLAQTLVWQLKGGFEKRRAGTAWHRDLGPSDARGCGRPMDCSDNPIRFEACKASGDITEDVGQWLCRHPLALPLRRDVVVVSRKE